jgi:6,7-dimethyl-8-ribityllumazine synthase
MKHYEGHLQAQGLRFHIVVGRFNELIGSKLLEGAQDAIRRMGADLNNVSVTWVPGAYEIPLAAQALAKRQDADAIICLGAVIRGQTPHFDYVAGEVSKGVAQVGLDQNLPVIFGVLTTDTIEQALERAGTKAGNKGFEAAVSAIEMANLMQALKK